MAEVACQRSQVYCWSRSIFVCVGIRHICTPLASATCIFSSFPFYNHHLAVFLILPLLSYTRIVMLLFLHFVSLLRRMSYAIVTKQAELLK